MLSVVQTYRPYFKDREFKRECDNCSDKSAGKVTSNTIITWNRSMGRRAIIVTCTTEPTKYPARWNWVRISSERTVFVWSKPSLVRLWRVRPQCSVQGKGKRNCARGWLVSVPRSLDFLWTICYNLCAGLESVRNS